MNVNKRGEKPQKSILHFKSMNISPDFLLAFSQPTPTLNSTDILLEWTFSLGKKSKQEEINDRESETLAHGL